MRIHLPGLPHTTTTREWCTCAFTTKIRHLSDMLTAQGHEVFLYSGEANEAVCAEHIVVATDEDRRRWFGDETWKDRVFDRWDVDDPCWEEFNNNIIKAMADRVGLEDALALPMGVSQQQISTAYPNLLTFESGIGYECIIPEVHHVFETYAWMHNRYAAYGIIDGSFYDTVIPNAFDPNEFTFKSNKDDYILFLGRHTPRKGLGVVEEVAKYHQVITAGQDAYRVPGAEYVGVVRGQERADLLANARALLAPTQYIEPFGGVVVEAQLSGTPVITTDFGAFTETVSHGVNGFRCSLLQDFLDAVDHVENLDPVFIRELAEAKYSVATVGSQYDAYLRRLATLWGQGWYSRRTE